VGFSRVLDALQIHAKRHALHNTRRKDGMWVSFPKGFGKLSTKLNLAFRTS
jgi:hypothetical protein